MSERVTVFRWWRRDSEHVQQEVEVLQKELEKVLKLARRPSLSEEIKEELSRRAINLRSEILDLEEKVQRLIDDEQHESSCRLQARCRGTLQHQMYRGVLRRHIENEQTSILQAIIVRHQTTPLSSYREASIVVQKCGRFRLGIDRHKAVKALDSAIRGAQSDLAVESSLLIQAHLRAKLCSEAYWIMLETVIKSEGAVIGQAYIRRIFQSTIEDYRLGAFVLQTNVKRHVAYAAHRESIVAISCLQGLVREVRERGRLEMSRQPPLPRRTPTPFLGLPMPYPSVNQVRLGLVEREGKHKPKHKSAKIDKYRMPPKRWDMVVSSVLNGQAMATLTLGRADISPMSPLKARASIATAAQQSDSFSEHLLSQSPSVSESALSPMPPNALAFAVSPPSTIMKPSDRCLQPVPETTVSLNSPEFHTLDGSERGKGGESSSTR